MLVAAVMALPLAIAVSSTAMGAVGISSDGSPVCDSGGRDGEGNSCDHGAYCIVIPALKGA